MALDAAARLRGHILDHLLNEWHTTDGEYFPAMETDDRMQLNPGLHQEESEVRA